MINRRHIRTKVLNTCYAIHFRGSDDINIEIKNFEYNILKVKDLYIIMLDAIVWLQKIAEERMEIRKNKFNATAEDLSPNTRFIQNPLLCKIANNENFIRYKKQHKINPWHLNKNYLQDIFIAIEKSESYQNYMASKNMSYKKHRDFIIDLYCDFIAPNELIRDHLEECRMDWAADLPFINSAIVMNLRHTNKKAAFEVKPIYGNKNDEEFAVDLLSKTLQYDTAFETQIKEQLQNWELERLSKLDLTFLKMGICEMTYFHDIPTRVTLNEYIELAKDYSEEKGYIFINGILDKVSKMME